MKIDERIELARAFDNNLEHTKVYYLTRDNNRAFLVTGVIAGGDEPYAKLENGEHGKYTVSLKTVQLSDFALITRLA